jgi:hypothetical protein
MTTAKTQGLGQKKTIHFIELHLLDSIAGYSATHINITDMVRAFSHHIQLIAEFFVQSLFNYV